MPQLLLKQSFNTASGKYCYFITFVFPSFQSGTRDVRASSSLCSSAASHPSSHTVNGKYYSIITFVFPSLQARTRDVRTPSSLCASVPRTLRRIPQAVSTVATISVRITKRSNMLSFNTASGKYCCNKLLSTSCSEGR